MSQKEMFLEELNVQFETYRDCRKNESSALLRENAGFDFDLDATFAEWAKTVGVDYLMIDVAKADQKDIEEIQAHWNRPTAYLFKNYGNESAGNYRNKISCFIKDRYLGLRCSDDPEPQVVACLATVLKDQPIRDFYEWQVFGSCYDF